MMPSSKAVVPIYRIILGAIILVLGFLAPLATPFVLETNLSTPIKTLISGALVFGIPEVMMIAAVAIMGKEAWEWIKSKLWSGLEFISPQRVSKSRYYVGVFLFSFCLVEGAIELHSNLIQHWIGDYMSTYQWIMNGLFLLSFIIAGGEFWDKIRLLFIYNQNPSNPST